MDQAQAQAAYEALPEFSRKVYQIIKAKLYAEPGFSDVTAEDVSQALSVPVQAVNASLGHLEASGLVNSEEWDGNGITQIFLHTAEHDAGWTLDT